MSIISVITPVYRPESEHLRAVRDSLAKQELPEGWELEWILQEDGRSGVAEELLSPEPWISFGGNPKGGVAITRNLALRRARGELVKNLDQDDMLTEGALARDIEALAAHPEVGWVTTRVSDLLPDGSLLSFDNDPEPGRIEPGMPRAHWEEHNYRLPVHPTTVCIRRSLALALGGWMAVPYSDDTALLIAASTISPGWFVGEVGLLYRKWEGQASAEDAEVTERADRMARMELIAQRADALAALWAERGGT